jgi:inhibitor of KinA sporulation pathway (predicted exonuclease)
MKYFLCVLDFEATCWNDDSKPKQQMEIIEFPCVLFEIDEEKGTRTYISEFAKYVRPCINKILSPFCTQLTGIEQETVNNAELFPDVYAQNIKWLKSHVPHDAPFVFATCGHWDFKTQLLRDIRHHKLKLHPYYTSYINVKDEYETFYRMKAKGMPGMLESLGLTLEGRHHSGIDDTRNIAKIMLKIIEDGGTYKHFKINYLNNNNV